MTIQFTNVDIDKHKADIVEYHCRTNYAANTFAPGKKPLYETYCKKWTRLEGEQFFEFIVEQIAKQCILIKMIINEDEAVVGYFYTTFQKKEEWDVHVADIGDIYLSDQYQKKGIGLQILNLIEMECKKVGANLIRSGTAPHNRGSVRLHEKTGFEVCRYEFEKWL